jgi:hypothetical protein
MRPSELESTPSLREEQSMCERKEEGFAQKLGLSNPRAPPDPRAQLKIEATVVPALQRAWHTKLAEMRFVGQALCLTPRER